MDGTSGSGTSARTRPSPVRADRSGGSRWSAGMPQERVPWPGTPVRGRWFP